MTASHPSTGRGSSDISASELERIEATLQVAVGRCRPRWLNEGRDDLVQKALIRILNNRGEGNSQFSSSYLWKTARSVVVDQIRHEQRKRETPLEHIAELAPAAIETRGPETEYETHQLRHALEKALQSLSRDRRIAVTLFLQGHTVREVSEILQWSYKRTENLVYRGYEELRTYLGARGFKP